jgi:hypothetical protein
MTVEFTDELKEIVKDFIAREKNKYIQRFEKEKIDIIN